MNNPARLPPALERLYQWTILPAPEAQAFTCSIYTAANTLVACLVGRAVLVEATGYRRHRVSNYEAYIDIVCESGEVTAGASA